MYTRIVIFFAIVFQSINVLSQTPFFQSYQLLKRKEPVAINAMLQTREGIIWIGTSEGLFRFDGREYIYYTVKDSLPDNHITALAQDESGKIWIGCNNGKISTLSGESFTAFEPEEGTSSKPISDILFDKKGNLWFGTLNDGLYYYINNRLFRLDEENGMPDLYIYDLAIDEHGNVLAGTDGGVAICTLSRTKASITVINYSSGLPDNIVKKIIIQGNKLVIATEDAGVIIYDPVSKKSESVVDTWQYGPVSDFIVNDQNYWIACPQHGLLIVDKQNKKYNLVDNQEVNNITSLNVLLHDSEGNVWAAGKAGLLRTPGTILQYFSQTHSQAMTLAVIEDKQGNIWYSTYDGLFKIQANGAVHDAVKQLEKTPFEKNTVISLYADTAGYVWAGLYGEGVLRIDPVTAKIRHIQSEINNGNILNITGRGNVVWLATLGGCSRITFNKDLLAFENFGRAQGLSSDFIYQTLLDSRGRVWFATDGKGVDMLDEQGFHHFDKGLPAKVVYTVFEDGEKNIWANVQGYGLYKLDERGSFQPLPEALATRETELHAVTSDANGNIIVFHNSGMDIIDLVNKRIRYLGDEAGLRDKIANLNALSRDNSGSLLIGTNTGIIKYVSGGDYFNHEPIPIISSVKIFDTKVPTESIVMLDYDQDNLTFNFTGLWYQSPENVVFSYKLENYDLEWITTKNTSVTYSKLPPGQYVFKVKASINGIFNTNQEAVIAFNLRPPFWKTPPFYILSAALSVIAIYFFMRFRERKLMNDKIILEAKVRRRTMEVQRQNDEIQAQNEEIMAQAEEIKGINEHLELIVHERTAELERKNKALEEYAFINAHKLRSPVASILGLVNLISKTQMDDEGTEISKRLKTAANELDDIVRSITKAIEQSEKDPIKEKE